MRYPWERRIITHSNSCYTLISEKRENISLALKILRNEIIIKKLYVTQLRNVT